MKKEIVIHVDVEDATEGRIFHESVEYMAERLKTEQSNGLYGRIARALFWTWKAYDARWKIERGVLSSAVNADMYEQKGD